MKRKSEGSKRVAIVAADGVSLRQLAILYDVFTCEDPPDTDDQFITRVVSEKGKMVRPLGGAGLETERIADIPACEVLAIPGWEYGGEPSRALAENVLRLGRSAVQVAAVGSGVYVAVCAGLLGGEKVAAPKHFIERMARMFPNVIIVPDSAVVDGAGCVTGDDGLLSPAEVGLRVVARLCGGKEADRRASVLGYNWLWLPGGK